MLPLNSTLFIRTSRVREYTLKDIPRITDVVPDNVFPALAARESVANSCNLYSLKQNKITDFFLRCLLYYSRAFLLILTAYLLHFDTQYSRSCRPNRDRCLTTVT